MGEHIPKIITKPEANAYFVQLPVNLKVLNMSYIKISLPVIPLNFDPDNSLKILDASNDMLTSMLGPWKGLNMLETLNLTNNQLSWINQESFSYMTSLRVLLLGQNKIGAHIMRYNGDKMSPVKRICVLEHSVMTNFNCACPAIQRGQGSGFLSEGFSWLTTCMSEQRRFWRDCADAQARLNLRCSHRR